MPVLISTSGSQAAAAVETLRAEGIPATWRSCGDTCVVTVPLAHSDRAGEILSQEPGCGTAALPERVLTWAGYAIVTLLLVTAVLVFAS